MTATRNNIESWLKKPSVENATHMLVVCDTFDNSDYPVYVQANQDVKQVMAEYNARNMQRVEEVYSFAHDLEEQLNTQTAWCVD